MFKRNKIEYATVNVGPGYSIASTIFLRFLFLYFSGNIKEFLGTVPVPIMLVPMYTSIANISYAPSTESIKTFTYLWKLTCKRAHIKTRKSCFLILLHFTSAHKKVMKRLPTSGRVNIRSTTVYGQYIMVVLEYLPLHVLFGTMSLNAICVCTRYTSKQANK